MHFIRSGIMVLGLSQAAYAEDALSRVWTDQGWSDLSSQTTSTWYNISQGSRLIRLDWYKALAASGAVFGGRAMETDYGFPFWDDVAELPIGFVPDVDDNGTQWLGLNCAACHTSRLTYNQTELMIHGGQSLGDFRSFLGDLTKSVRATHQNADKAEALFAALPNNGGYRDIDALQRDLDAWLAHRDGIDRVLEGLNRDQGWGYGRADAVSYIQAATASVIKSTEPEFVSPANAPVNYPAAWNANQQGALQHNGLVANGQDLSLFDENVKLGAYIRNWTEALGVFAAAEMDADGKLQTSIIGPNLLKIEKSLATLQSPVWPAEVFGEIDPELASVGAGLYDQNCVSCHAIVADPTDLRQTYPLDDQACSTRGSSFDDEPFVCVQPVVDFSVTRAAVTSGLAPSRVLTGTDPMMTCNIMLHRIATGKLEGKRKNNTFKSTDGLNIYEDTAFTNQIMASLIIKDLVNQMPELLAAQLESETLALVGVVKSWFDAGGLDGGLRGDGDDFNNAQELLMDCAQGALLMNGMNPAEFPLPGYKARPLNGIWATAPYLHNGSVPSLFDLLRAPQDRPTEFNVPLGAFDPVKVGLAQDQGGFRFRTLDANGSAIVGNSNLGHPYGANLTDADRHALVTYIKGL